MQFKSIKVLIFTMTTILCYSGSLFSQNLDDDATRYRVKYEENIQKSQINGVYIPKDMDDAFEELKSLTSVKALQKFKSAKEEIVAHKLHFGLGRWIYLHWNFEEGSRYVKYLNEKGLEDFDDMVQFTIVSFHRHLNQTPQEYEQRIAGYKKKEEEKKRERRDRDVIIEVEGLD